MSIKRRMPEYFNNFVCTHCHKSNLTKVIDSRRLSGGRIMRIRGCLLCKTRFTTFEQIANASELHDHRISELFREAVAALKEIHTLMQDKK